MRERLASYTRMTRMHGQHEKTRLRYSALAAAIAWDVAAAIAASLALGR